MDSKQDCFKEFEVPDAIRIKKVIAFIRTYFNRLEGLSILECGYAKGGLCDGLKSKGVRCVGLDLNARKQVDGVIFKQGDLNDGFPNFGEKFDVIFAGELMEHLFDDEAFLRNAKSLLRPGGLLMLTVPNLAFLANRIRILFGLTPMFTYAPYHYHMYTRRTLEDMLVGQGYEIVKFTSSHVLFSTRRHPIGVIFEMLGDSFPSFGAHLMVYARSKS